MRQIALALLLFSGFAFTGCARHSVSLQLQQNGLNIHTTVHRDSRRRDWRILTFALQDAASGQPVSDAEVAVVADGAAAQRAVNKGGGSYETQVHEPPGSSADLSVAVVAHHRTVLFHLVRP